METEREKERTRERGKERKDGRRGVRGGRTIFALLLHTVKSKRKKQGEFDMIASAC